ncbi:fibronectin type III domain-containing protein [Paenibacillus lutrae]|uniref:chitinase n=1 Tax=Paenibacillus lutrae TaxID=2078573 RepID=A0A7X3FL52_9BACL|nr:glycosyl hydrolase family 18 protein [Paenibacillus lutrae]MVP01322.1 carbohydrate-binding protein [Paenibacillus lutrae]
MKKDLTGQKSIFKKASTLVLTTTLFLSLIPAMASAADRGAWTASTSYASGDTVSYGGKTYQVVQPHTSLNGWEPPNVPALWKVVTGGGTPDTQAPSAPSNLRVSGTSTTTSIALAWNAASDNVGVTGYDIYRGTTLIGSASGTALTYTDTGLTANTTYTYTVKAKDAAGNVSGVSNTLSAATQPGSSGPDTQAPTVPAGLASTGATTSSVSLSWNASTDNVGVTQYEVYRNGTLALAVTGTTATVTGLAADTSYNFTVKAKDGAGNVSAASAAISAKTQPSGGGSGQLPKHILTGYWQNFVNGAKNLKLRDVPAEYDIIAVSFAEMDRTKPGGVTFAIDPSLATALGGYTEAEFLSDIKAKQAQGKKIILSIGGEKGNIDLSSASPNVKNFVDSMSALITQYGFDGLDVDLEHGFNVPNMTSAARQLQQKVGPSFILTMAPQTIDMQSNQSSYLQFYANVKDITTVINTQYYNSGCMLGRDGKCYSQGTVDFLTALTDLTLQWVPASQLGLGVPATPSAAGGGYVSAAVVNQALNCLATGNSCGSYKPVAKYPDIRGAMTWSINWDGSNGYTFAKTVKPQLNSMP